MSNSTQLTFLNTTTNDGGQKPDRRLVWSFAAKHSHRVAPRVRRKKALNYRQPSPNKQSYHEWALADYASSSSSSSSRRSPTSSASDDSSKATHKTSGTLKRRRRSSNIPDEEVEVLLRTFAKTPPGSPLSASKRCPFDSYPVPFQNWFGQLLDFWFYTIVPRSTAVIKMAAPELEEYRTWALQSAMTDPALFYTSLFLASGIPVSAGRLPLSNAIWLRIQVVKSLNEALSDPKRATSTAVILAIGRIAHHEHVYGDRTLSHTVHRPAQQRLLAMRGGIENLNLPVTTLQMIVWSDSLIAGESGTDPIFSNVVKDGLVKSYSSKEAQSVTELCSPDRFKHPGFDE